MSFSSRLVVVMCLVACGFQQVPLTGHRGAQARASDNTQPVAGLRTNTPAVYALKDVRIVRAPGEVLEQGVLVVRDGVISAIGANVPIPADARVWSRPGITLYPGLIDGFSELEISPGDRPQGAHHWNELIRPEVRVADRYQSKPTLNASWRSQGITTRLIAPPQGILKGRSALVATGDASRAASILEPDVALHARLTVPRGRGRNAYPNSPMGAVALARQTMLDANWYQQAWSAFRSQRGLPRPDQDLALEVLGAYSGSGRLVVIDAPNELYALRADRFAREFSLNLVIRGSGREYRQLSAIQALGRPVIVPLNFPKPPNVGTAEAALNASLESMRHWELAPENPARLSRAGVSILLTRSGLPKAVSLLAAVRKAVQHGLAADAALAALTTTPAKLFGVEDRLGTLHAGKRANFLLTDGALFATKTKVLETWVDGRPYENIPARNDPAGRWRLVGQQETRPLLLDVTVAGEKLSGAVRRAENPDAADAAPATPLLRLAAAGDRLTAIFDAEAFGQKGVARLTLVLFKKEKWSGRGQVIWPDGVAEKITATHNSPTRPGGGANREKPPQPAVTQSKPKRVREPLRYPLGAFGVLQQPEQPEHVLFKNATLWTCAQRGILRNAEILIGGGKILSVGRRLRTPPGTRVIDCQGKHITPGIVDCHSHMATDGGVNESAQAITAEVRIGDFIDSNDVNIYRQLAGGVTSSNILHGSANPIGGQNQVIKLRWGALPEDLKFVEAPAGIKFALGENVKQSNWGDEFTTRYPQTRMGVEQIIRGTFQAALDYQQRWRDWERQRQGLPPRRDLELEAISEVLGGQRWIHCHSYRQDEVLALIRTLDDFQITIGTFQHILEGYKVADALARHGAMASAFSDWWAYKFEVYDAIPYAGALMHNAGVVVSFNSDDRELARHLNHEAAKAVKYGGVPRQEALKFVTLNPARQLRIDRYVGSLESGKHADLVVWSKSPLSTFSVCEQTWIDGRRYFSRSEDLRRRESVRRSRTRLVQKILASGEVMLKPGEATPPDEQLWPREDVFCHHHRHVNGHD
ncbi:MAG: amidohydrolase [Planctomycetaceae bacterium]|nr:amidohydrolase [Planctomycetaceae bacterium]